ncbi:hypothetical protein IQ05_00144 [Flavobacterium tiangeerense]|uniref:F0F1-ATPase subunit (Ca2+/Mg2+ transporter) n=1 Tax=Flavobacterium tiangeerense TaxID=459471 RepID=A0ABY3FNR5_9FLAO|nr:hypothetical protein IQ05_00144 [Flavobacterium tiangeerense]
MPKDKNILSLICFVSIVIGLWLSYYGNNLPYANNKKIGYPYMATGLIILFVNAVYFVLKFKK